MSVGKYMANIGFDSENKDGSVAVLTPQADCQNFSKGMYLQLNRLSNHRI
jgi:hypothetical protein